MYFYLVLGKYVWFNYNLSKFLSLSVTIESRLSDPTWCLKWSFPENLHLRYGMWRFNVKGTLINLLYSKYIFRETILWCFHLVKVTRVWYMITMRVFPLITTLQWKTGHNVDHGKSLACPFSMSFQGLLISKP